MEEEAEAKEAKAETTQPVHAEASWRELSVNDMKTLTRVADKIHPDLPESDQVFAERVELFPERCLGLLEGKGKTRSAAMSFLILSSTANLRL